MPDEAQTTGTPIQDGGDAAPQPTAGTPEPEGRNAGDDERWKEALAWKEKAERYNEVQQELAQLRARSEQPRATSPAGGEEFNPTKYEAYLDNLAANATDTGSQLWIQKERTGLREAERSRAHNQQLEQVIGYVLRALPEEQQAPFKEMQAHPEKYASLDDAQGEINLRKRDAEVSKLQQEIKRLQNQNAVPTSGRETQSVPEFKKEMTGSEWNRRQASLPFDQKYAEQKKLRNGEIKVNW